jgi:hypothetical protein
VTGFIVVDGAAQHGLSITGIFAILVLITAYFLLMFVCSHFSADTTSCRRDLRSGSALIVDVVKAEWLTEVAALGPKPAHVIGIRGFTDARSEGGHSLA